MCRGALVRALSIFFYSYQLILLSPSIGMCRKILFCLLGAVIEGCQRSTIYLHRRRLRSMPFSDNGGALLNLIPTSVWSDIATALLSDIDILRNSDIFKSNTTVRVIVTSKLSKEITNLLQYRTRQEAC
jgi:hypothetical protein